jgi:two-component system response regulator RegX3
MIVSARDADEDIINGLQYGADEFVTKPFSPGVLVARVQANLRRKNLIKSSGEEVIEFGDYSLLLNSCVLKKEGKKIPLSTKEYDVLEYLVKNAGQVLSPEKIFNDVWKVQYGDITAVAVYIQRLRKKLETDPSNACYIKTEFGKGYIFNKDYIK